MDRCHVTVSLARDLGWYDRGPFDVLPSLVAQAGCPYQQRSREGRPHVILHGSEVAATETRRDIVSLLDDGILLHCIDDLVAGLLKLVTFHESLDELRVNADVRDAHMDGSPLVVDGKSVART